MAKRDYYEVLGLRRDATDAQIKAAYRKAARKHHPDVNKASDSAEKFREATEAYEALSDPQKRRMYDQFGHAGAGMKPGMRPGGAGAPAWGSGGGAEAFHFEDIFGSAGGSGFAGMGLDDILNALRGRSSRGGRRGGYPPAQRGGDLEYHLTLDFMQAVRGVTTAVRIQDSRGGGQTINVKIPAGVHEGSRVRLQGKGQAGGAGPGDLYIVTHVGEHPYFRRDGDDIYVELPISVVEAVLGAKVDAPTIDGMSTVTIPPGSGSGRKLRLRGKGVPSASGGPGRGDEYVVLKIVAPQNVSPRGADMLRQFEQSDRYDPREDVKWR